MKPVRLHVTRAFSLRPRGDNTAQLSGTVPDKATEGGEAGIVELPDTLLEFRTKALPPSRRMSRIHQRANARRR